MSDRERILNALRKHPEGCYGLDLAELAGVKVGHLYPVLHQLEQTAAVRSEWAERAPNGLRRRLYFAGGEQGDSR